MQMNRCRSKIGIGTVQWGMRYGVSNTNGQTSPQEAGSILKLAKEAGIKLVDTASLYGNAEVVLGESSLEPFLVVTKTPRFDNRKINKDDAIHLLNAFQASLSRLNVQSVYGLLIHDATNITSPGGEYLVEALKELQHQKRVLKIGFSAYESSQVEHACEYFSPDIVQVPINVFDQRLILDGTIQHLSKLGVELHARSIFLQGLLLMEPASVPAYFSPWIRHIESWHNLCSRIGILPQVAALEWACNIPEISYALIGIQNASQLNELISSSVEFHFEDFSLLARSEKELLNPSLWAI